MMDYMTFKVVAQKRILDYFPEEFKDAKVEVMPVVKVNKTKDAIMIRKDDSTGISPNLYLDDLYEHYRASGDVGETLGMAADLYMDRLEDTENFDFPEFSTEYIKENVFMMLVNTESNAELLKDIPHREVNDCSVFYRILIEKTDDGIASTVLDHNMAEIAGMGEQEIFLAATENTKRLFPPNIQPMTEIIRAMMVKDGMPEEIAEAVISDMGQSDFPMWVITNDCGINGAVNMLYDENLQKVAEKIQDDLYILPSSTHEVICVPAGSGDPERLAEMVQDVNMSEVSVEERLSNQVYHYDKELRKLTMATDTPNKRIEGIVAEQPLIYEAKKR